MSVYNIPRKFKTGEFKFNELNNSDGECLELDYDNEYQMINYDAPMYESEVRVYTVPRDKMPDGLTAVYDKNGELEKVELDDGGKTRLFYMWFKDIMKIPTVRSGRHFLRRSAREQGNFRLSVW